MFGLCKRTGLLRTDPQVVYEVLIFFPFCATHLFDSIPLFRTMCFSCFFLSLTM